jgi:hypothetical protein
MRMAALIALSALFATGLVLQNSAAATGAVVKIDVPPFVEWCVNSAPIQASKLAEDGFRNGAVTGLSSRILVPANNAGLSSTGIPFVASIVPGPTVVVNGVSSATDVITVCAVVKATDAPNGSGVFRRDFAGASGYAALCGAGDIKACRGAIADKIAADFPSVDRSTADSWQWRSTQALASDESAGNLIGSLADASLRPLKGATRAGVPADLMVVLAFPPGQEPKTVGGP